MIEIRPYQLEVIEQFERTVAAGKRRVILVAPTGSGKTVIAAEIIRRAVAAGKRVLFIAHRRELIVQAGERLWAHGIDSGTIQAGFPPRPGEPVQVASIQTLWARAIRTAKIPLPMADIVIVDEAHHQRATTYERIVGSYPTATILGLTATPCRGDGRGLGNAFDELIECPQVPALIKLGHLVGTRVFAPSTPDLKGVKTVMGDYQERALSRRVNTDDLVGDVVTHWHRLAERRRTVAFAVDVAHSVHIRNEFIHSGVRAAHIDGGTPKDERDRILAQLKSGEVELVSNCMVLTEGWDSPDVACCILARPTKNMGLFRQMIGRVLRPAAGKTDALILDHSGAVFEHGFVEDEVRWELAEDRQAENTTKFSGAGNVGKGRQLTSCPKCAAVRLEGDGCSVCGWMPAPKPAPVWFKDGDLGEVRGDRTVLSGRSSPEEKLHWRRELTWIAKERGWKDGWVAHKFKERFGSWPPRDTVEPLVASPEVKAWVRAKMIAWAKRQPPRQPAAPTGHEPVIHRPTPAKWDREDRPVMPAKWEGSDRTDLPRDLGDEF